MPTSSSPTSPTVLEITDLSAGYRTTQVLSHLSTQARSGDFIALLGANGSGKTTLLRCISGVLPLRQGRITVNGGDLASCSRKERARLIACVPQRPAVPSGLRVEDFVRLGRYPHLHFLGRPTAHDRAVVGEALERTDSLRFRDRQVEELSGGELQRVLLALALAQESPILLLDELSAGIDLAGLLSLFDLLRRLCRDGHLILAAMHDYNLANSYATRILGLIHGKISVDAPIQDAFTAPHLSALYGVPMVLLDAGSHGPAVALPSQERRP